MCHSCRSSFSLAALLWLALGALLAGCRSTSPRPGVPVEVPKPYLLVETSGDSGVSMQVVYLPDFTSRYTLAPKGRFGGGSFRVELTDQGFLAGLSTGLRGAEVTPAPLPAEAQADSADRPVSSLGSLRSSGRSLEPGLYEIKLDASGKISGLQRLPWMDSGNQGNGRSSLPVIREVRFLADPARPERAREVLVSLDGFRETTSCPPEDLSVAVTADGGSPFEPCRYNPGVVCDAAAHQVRCPFEPRGDHVQYVARATMQARPGGIPASWAASVGEAIFPPFQDGFAQLAPTARVSFGTLPNGRVRTVAIEYDPRGGSCVDANAPGRVRVHADGTLQTYPGSKPFEPSLSGNCFLGMLIPVVPPAKDVSVTVEPQNLSGLIGKMVFAATAAPPPPIFPPVPEPPQMIVSVQPHDTITIPQPDDHNPQNPPPNGDPPPNGNPPPKQPGQNGGQEPSHAEIVSIRGNLRGSWFSDFVMRFRADSQTASRGIPVKIGRVDIIKDEDGSEEEDSPGGQNTITIIPACGTNRTEACKRIPDKDWLKAQLTSIVATQTTDLEATIPLPSSFVALNERAHAPAGLYCLELKFRRKKGGEDCYTVIVDESLLQPAPEEEP